MFMAFEAVNDLNSPKCFRHSFGTYPGGADAQWQSGFRPTHGVRAVAYLSSFGDKVSRRFQRAGAWAFFAPAVDPRAPPHDNSSFSGVYGFLAIAFLTKGMVGLGIPALGMAVYLLWSRRLGGVFGWHIVLGCGLIGGAVALWLWLLWREGGRASLDTFLVYNQLGRFFPDAETYQGGHVRPIWYYLLTTPVDLLPWTLFVILAGLSAWRNWKRFPELQSRRGSGYVSPERFPSFWHFLWPEQKEACTCCQFSP